MQTAAELNDAFGLPEILVFDEPHAGMPRLRVSTPACQAELFLQGAHLVQWQPADCVNALFLSPQSNFQPGKAIRGGIPVIFPWFGSPANSPVHTKPSAGQHGFARAWPWTLRFAALAGEDVHLSLKLDQTEGIRALGFAGLELAWEAVLGKTMTVRLSVINTSASACTFEEALHTYLAVGEVANSSVEGLADTEYLDKTESFARKRQTAGKLHFEGEVDRLYVNTEAPLLLHDSILGRSLRLSKTGSRTTVTWNPGPALCAKMPDLHPDAWRRFVCLETANAGENALTLQPGEAHSMSLKLEIERP